MYLRERAQMEQNIKPLIMNVKECEIALEKRERESERERERERAA